MHHEIIFAPASEIPPPVILKRSRSLQAQQRRSYSSKPASSASSHGYPKFNSTHNNNKKQSDKGAASKKSPKKRNSATHIGTAHTMEAQDLQKEQLQLQQLKLVGSAPHSRRRSKSASVYAGAAFNSAAPEPSSLPVPTFTLTRKRTVSLNTQIQPSSPLPSRSTLVRQSFPARMTTSHRPFDDMSLSEIRQGIWSLLKINEP